MFPPQAFFFKLSFVKVFGQFDDTQQSVQVVFGFGGFFAGEKPDNFVVFGDLEVVFFGKFEIFAEVVLEVGGGYYHFFLSFIFTILV
jgi:hypothetical protein